MWKKTDKDISLLSQIALEITGCNFEHVERPAVNCITARMEYLHFDNLVRYIDFALKNTDEFAHLVSSLTIHTTYWFREPKHFSILKKWIYQELEKSKKLNLKIWSAACSTGEEVYSIACLLESIRVQEGGFEYSILGTDIDSISIDHARHAVYKDYDPDVMGEYSQFVKFLDEKHQEFTLVPSILSRCYFDVMSLFQLSVPEKTIDVIFIRNVLIYFNVQQIKKIMGALHRCLSESGLLVTGMSESVNSSQFLKIENTIYQKTDTNEKKSSKIYYFGTDKTFAKKYFSSIDGNSIEILGSNLDDSLKQLVRNFDDKTLAYFDLSDDNFKQYLDILGSMKDTLNPKIYLVYNTESRINHLSKAFKYKIKFAGFINKAFISQKSTSHINGKKPVKSEKPSQRPKAFKPKMILLGASTGGVDALVNVLSGIGPDCPPVFVLQHINLYFSSPFVKRIAEIAKLKLSNCLENEVVLPGHLYSPTGNFNIGLKEVEGKILIHRNKNQVADHWPLIDFTFESASYLSIPKVAILLTGMGSDGAVGLQKIHKSDSFCMIQDQKSSVVYGMPKIAKQLEAYDYIGNLDQIRAKLFGML